MISLSSTLAYTGLTPLYLFGATTWHAGCPTPARCRTALACSHPMTSDSPRMPTSQIGRSERFSQHTNDGFGARHRLRADLAGKRLVARRVRLWDDPAMVPLADLRRGWLGRGEKSWEAIMSSITRTRFIALVAALTVLLAAGAVSAQTVKMAVPTFLTGAGAPAFGVPAKQGVELMVRAINKGSLPAPYNSVGLAGRKIDLVVYDESRRRHQAGHRATQQGAEGTGRPDRRVRPPPGPAPPPPVWPRNSRC